MKNLSSIEEWKKRNEERYKSMLQRMFDSDYAKKWMKELEEDKEEEVEFYGRELTEQERKTNLLDNFFEQDLKDIVAVLPELLEEIKEEVKGELEYTVLESPEKLEEHIGGGLYQTVNVPFSLSKYLGNIQDDLQKTLKKGEKP